MLYMNNDYFISTRISGDKHEFADLGELLTCEQEIRELLDMNFSPFNFFNAFIPHATKAISTRITPAIDIAIYKFLDFVLFGFFPLEIVGRKAGVGGGGSETLKSMMGTFFNGIKTVVFGKTVGLGSK